MCFEQIAGSVLGAIVRALQVANPRGKVRFIRASAATENDNIKGGHDYDSIEEYVSVKLLASRKSGDGAALRRFSEGSWGGPEVYMLVAKTGGNCECKFRSFS